MFSVGQRVHMSNHGKICYSDSHSNPYNCGGVIDRISGASIRVVWDNGTYNTYRVSHLKLASSLRGIAKFLRKVEGKDTEEEAPKPKPKPKKGFSNPNQTITGYQVSFSPYNLTSTGTTDMPW